VSEVIKSPHNWLAAFRRELRAERPIFIGFLIYFALAGTVARSQHYAFNPFEFALKFGPTLALLVFLWLVLHALFLALKHHREAPLAALPSLFRGLLTPHLAIGLLLVPFLLVFIQCFLSIKILLPKFMPFVWDATLAGWDNALHGDTDPWFLLQPYLGHAAVTRALEVVYSALWLLAVLLFPILVAFSVKSRALRWQYFFTYLLCWFLLGNVLAGFMLSGGPVYFDVFTGDSTRFAPIISYLQSLGSHELSALAFRDILLEIHQTGKMSQFGGISAMPSMHMSMATLFACVAARLHRGFFVFSLGFLAAMLLASVHLGWHYAIDGYAAIILTLVIWKIAGLVTAKALRTAPPQ
jgi:hypothetical protein